MLVGGEYMAVSNTGVYLTGARPGWRQPGQGARQGEATGLSPRLLFGLHCIQRPAHVRESGRFGLPVCHTLRRQRSSIQ